MPTILQFRRGTAAQNAAFTGSSGEISINTDRNTLHVHDGSTQGGEELVGISASQTLTNKTLTSPELGGTPTIGGTAITEWVQDVAGAMWSGNTETAITVTYQDADGTIDIAHNDTSSQASVNNSGNTFIQDVTLDDYGHVTALSSATVVVPGTSDNVQYNSFGVGTAASGTAGQIRATNTIVAYYSDERLKKDIQLIENAVDKVKSLRGVTYHANELAESFGYDAKEDQVGVIAQDVKEVLPEAVKPAPFDRIIIEGTEISKSGQEYMTVQYEKIVPLLIEAIKEQQAQIDELKSKLGE